MLSKLNGVSRLVPMECSFGSFMWTKYRSNGYIFE